MAINPDVAFPGKTAGVSPEYPYGKARDVSSPGDGTGTPLKAAWVNDWFGLQQQLLSLAGITPSGVADAVGACQVWDALAALLMTRDDLSAPTGATLVGRGSSTVDSDLFKIENRYFTLQYFGGDDNGTTDNAAALSAAKAAGVKAVNLNHLKNGVYYFATNTPTLFDDITLVCEDGVIISVPQTDNYELVDKLTLQGHAVVLDRAIQRQYSASGDRLRGAAIPLFNSERKVSHVTSAQLGQFTGTLGSDTLTPQTFTDTGGAQLTMPSMAANGIALVTYPCEINERVGFNWASETFSKGVCILTKNEMYLVYSSSAVPGLNLYYKKVGVAPVTSTITKPISSYSLERAQCAVQRLSAKSCRILSNNASLIGLVPEIVMESEILSVGSVYVSTGPGESVNVKNFFIESGFNVTNITAGVALYGDSLTDYYANNWPELTADILLANGLSTDMHSFAVAGENSTQQLARFNTNGVGNDRLFGFILGTNDIQGSVPLATTLSNLDSFCTAVQAAGRKVFVGVPPIWMTLAMGGGTGYTTSNYDKGSDYRGSIIRYCLERKIPYFEMAQSMGYADSPSNKFIRDNIHQSATGYVSVAIAAANTIANMLKPTLSSVAYRPLTPLGSVTLYAGLEGKAALSAAQDRVLLAGLLDIGGLALPDGTALFSVQLRYRPKKNKFIPITTSYGAAAHIQLSASNGVASVYGLGTVPASAWASLDSASYDLSE